MDVRSVYHWVCTHVCVHVCVCVCVCVYVCVSVYGGLYTPVCPPIASLVVTNPGYWGNTSGQWRNGAQELYSQTAGIGRKCWIRWSKFCKKAFSAKGYESFYYYNISTTIIVKH